MQPYFQKLLNLSLLILGTAFCFFHLSSQTSNEYNCLLLRQFTGSMGGECLLNKSTSFSCCPCDSLVTGRCPSDACSLWTDLSFYTVTLAASFHSPVPQSWIFGNISRTWRMWDFFSLLWGRPIQLLFVPAVIWFLCFLPSISYSSLYAVHLQILRELKEPPFNPQILSHFSFLWSWCSLLLLALDTMLFLKHQKSWHSL